MAQKLHSPSHSTSPMSPPSPSFSDSSPDDRPSPTSEPQDTTGPSVSRPGSPVAPQPAPVPLDTKTAEEEDSATCMWDNCGLVFTHLPTLIEHIHNDHIGVHKSNYTCEWTTCQRRGLAQTSRFALISHIRSHTGEKPFICPLPECDKCFTRSDALAKHMRLQHNMEPPAPGRGGARKRKRGPDDQPPPPSRGQTPPPVPTSNGGFTTFKVEPSAHSEGLNGGPQLDLHGSAANGRRSTSPHSSLFRRRRPGSPDANRGDEDEADALIMPDALPRHLLPYYAPATGLVMDRPPSMIMYLLMKAKHRYAVEQHESLVEELRVAKAELERETEEKEVVLDDFLRGFFGPEAEQFIAPIPPPPNVSAPPEPRSGPMHLANGNGH